MCGIAGIWGGAASAELVANMADQLIHRGPDDAGIWADPDRNVALAHRRLAVVDLSAAGHQPMQSSCGRYTISYNGEIYNHLELRQLLRARQISWRGQSDSETLIESIAAWGLRKTLELSNGMFAFALWDAQEQTLLLARDRMGEKPLYYGFMGTSFLFASELKALKVHPAWQGTIDSNALALFMRHQYVPAPHSIYQGINKLRPGHFVRIQDGRTEEVCYWDLAEIGTRPHADINRVEAKTQLHALLRDSVATRMLSDVPLGTFLSGGYDSSLITALMTEARDQPVKTFTIGFEHEGFDEAPHARAIAEHLQTEHTELYVSERQALDVVPNIATTWCEPFADSSQIPTYLVSQMARQDVTVCLSGDGGDELFFGYPRYFKARKIRSQLATLPPSIRRLLGNLPMPDRLKRLQGPLRYPDNALFYREFVSHWKDPTQLVHGSTEPDYLFNTTSWPGVDFDQSMSLLDSLTYLPDDLLVKVDRASMAHSLEARVPLLDHRIVELAMSLPMHLKHDGNTGKQLLKSIAHDYIPQPLLDRPKMGFGIPLDSWLRGPLRDWAESLLAQTCQSNLLDGKLVHKLWREHLSGRRAWHYLIWDVLMFQAWLEQNHP